MRSFRVWHNSEKKMYYDGTLSFRNLSGYSWKKDDAIFIEPLIVVMRGAGILIRAKKTSTIPGLEVIFGVQEIFQHDILKISKSQIVVVVWDDQVAGFNTEPEINYADWDWNELMSDHLDRVEIIGNIHENPELDPR